MANVVAIVIFTIIILYCLLDFVELAHENIASHIHAHTYQNQTKYNDGKIQHNKNNGIILYNMILKEKKRRRKICVIMNWVCCALCLSLSWFMSMYVLRCVRFHAIVPSYDKQNNFVASFIKKSLIVCWMDFYHAIPPKLRYNELKICVF